MLALLLALQVTAVKADRIITVAGKEIEGGVILVRDGKIEAVGENIEIPDGARVIEAAVVMPGLVNPYGRTGLAGQGGSADQTAAEFLDPLSEGFLAEARAGYTTLVLVPTNGLISGRVAAVKTRPGPVASMLIAPDGALRISFTPSTQNKEALTKALKAAQEFIDAEKKAEEEKKKEKKEGEKKPDEGKKEGKEKPKEPTDADKVMMSVLKGERKLLVQVGSAAGLLHFWRIVDEYKEPALKIVYVLPPDLHRVAAKLGERKIEAVVDPIVTTLPNTADRICPARVLQEQKCAFAFQPRGADEALFDAAKLVKYGVERDAALRALTLTPATFAGIEARVGSIEKGKDADLLMLSADPFDAGARVRRVMIDGHVVYEDPS